MFGTLERGGLEALHFADPQQINNNGNAAWKGLWCLSGMDQQKDEMGPTAWILGQIALQEADVEKTQKCGHIFQKDKGHHTKTSAKCKQVGKKIYLKSG